MRCYLRNNGLAAYIVPSSDPHSSEYVAECWKSREWITGFDYTIAGEVTFIVAENAGAERSAIVTLAYGVILA